MYSCGSTLQGKLGLGNNEILVKRFSKVKFFEKNKFKIIDVACGGYHTVVLDEEFKI